MTRAGLDDPLAMSDGYVGVVAVVDHQRRRTEPSYQGRDVEIGPRHSQAGLQVPMHRGLHRAGDGQRLGEDVGEIRTSAGGASSTTRLATRPFPIAMATAAPPSECPTSPCSGPVAPPTALSARANSGSEAKRPADRPWPGPS